MSKKGEEKMMEKKQLTISILVSGRAETTFRCLDSLQPLCEAVDTELILVDTGCDTQLRKKLEAYATKIVPFTWCDDFSKARNAGLVEASGQWFLYLDDDEWFVDVQELIDFFHSGDYENYTWASYIQRNYLDMEGSQYTDTRVGRMAKITPELHFESRIHEYLTPTGGRHKNLTAIVEHYGYVYATEEDKFAHFKRNQVLLEKMIEEEPKRLRWRLQLLQEYRSVDDYNKMDALGAQGIAMINESDTPNDKEACVYIGSFYAARILAAEGKNDYEQVLVLCQEADRDKRNTEMCHAFLQEMRAKACFYRGLRSYDCEYAKKQYGQSEQHAQEYFDLRNYFDSHKEVLFDQQIAPFVGECFDVVKQKEIYSIRICNGLKLNQVQNLDQYVDELRWNEKHVYVFEEITDILIEAMNEFGLKYVGVEMPLNAEYKAYEKTLQIMQRQHALWEYFCEKIETMQNQGIEMQGVIRLIGIVFPDEVEQKTLTPEMELLATQVKEQIRLLISNGMQEEAMVAIQQIKKIIPQDRQLQELELMCSENGD